MREGASLRQLATHFDMDNLDRSYKIVKRSSALFLFSLLVLIVINPILQETFSFKLGPLFIVGPIIAGGVMSIFGLYLALVGSQYGQRNPKKRFYGLYGNLLFTLVIVLLIYVVIVDMPTLFGN